MVDLSQEQRTLLDLVISEYQDLEALDEISRHLGHMSYVEPYKVAFENSFWEEFGPRGKIPLAEALKNYYIILSNAVSTIKSEGRLFNPRRLIEEVVLEGETLSLTKKP